MNKEIKKWNKKIAFLDTETTGLNLLKDKPFKICVLFKDIFYFFDVNKPEELENFLQKEEIKEIWGWNIKYDLHMLLNLNVKISKFIVKIREGMLLKRYCDSLDENPALALKKDVIYEDIHQEWLQNKKDCKKKIDEVLTKYQYSIKDFEVDYKYNILNVPQNLLTFFKRTYFDGSFNLGYQKINNEKIEQYIKKDLLQTKKEVEQRLIKINDKEKDLIKNESLLVECLLYQEREGISINKDLLIDYLFLYQNELKKTIKKFKNKIGLDITPANHQKFKNRLIELFPHYKIESTDKSKLLKLYKNGDEDYDEIYELNFRIRNLQKIYNTYLRSFYMKEEENKIYTNFKLTHTLTGRLSSPLQQIPKKDSTEKGFLIRKLFNVEKDFYNFYFDYSQIELRITALYSILMKNPSKPFINAFISYPNKKNKDWKPVDLHLLTAKNAGLEKKYRDIAKTCNFLLLYGGGINALKSILKGVKTNIIEKLFSSFHKIYPEVKKMSYILSADVYRKGFFENIYGRKYHYKMNNQYTNNKLFNHLIQGTCAYILKKSMLKVYNYLYDKKSKIIYNLHDELHIKVHKKEINLINKIKTIMEDYEYKDILPLVVDINYSKKNWEEKNNEKIW